MPSLLRGSGLGAYRKICLLFKFVSYSPPSTHLERPERLPLRWRRVYAMFSRYNLLHHFFICGRVLWAWLEPWLILLERNSHQRNHKFIHQGDMPTSPVTKMMLLQEIQLRLFRSIQFFVTGWSLTLNTWNGQVALRPDVTVMDPRKGDAHFDLTTLTHPSQGFGGEGTC